MDIIKNLPIIVEVKLRQALSNPYVMAILKIVLVLYASQIAPRVSPKVSSIFQYTIVKIICVALIAYIAELDFQLAIILAVVFVLSINLLSGRGPLESYEDTEDQYTEEQPYSHEQVYEQPVIEEYEPYSQEQVYENPVIEEYEDSVPGAFTDKIGQITDLLGKPAKANGFTMLESKTDEFIGCQNVKLADLLAIFDNDAMKLQKTVQFTYHQLMEKMPKGTSKDNLMKIARAAGLPYNVPLNDENSPFLATILLQHGYYISKTCTAPN
jgi:hypothetical protein